MFKQGNYSKRALSTLEVVGSFIVDLYYNHFYQEAKKLRIDGRVESVTDGYKHVIKAYLNSFENPEAYRKTIIGIHKYYYSTTRFVSISFAECVDEIVKHFIPEDFFESTTNQQRDGTLRMVLMNAVKHFSSDILCSNLLDTIIDNHTEPGLVRRMQDKMVQALMFEREKMFQKVFNVSNKPAGGGDFTMVMKMKTEMVKLVKENHTIISKYKKLKNKAVGLLEIIKEQQEKIDQLKGSNVQLLQSADRTVLNKPTQPDIYKQKQSSVYPERGFNRYKEETRENSNDDLTLYIPANQNVREEPRRVETPRETVRVEQYQPVETYDTEASDTYDEHQKKESVSIVSPSDENFFSSDLMDIN